MPLFSAERAWSQAMELKKEAEVRGSAGAADPRKRQHLIRRLSKVGRWGGVGGGVEWWDGVAGQIGVKEWGV